MEAIRNGQNKIMSTYFLISRKESNIFKYDDIHGKLLTDS